MGDVYGAGLLAVAPLGLSDDDALGYLRQFAGLGLSRRFVEVLPSEERSCSGNFFLDEDLLRSVGVQDMDAYSVVPGAELVADFFV